MRLTDQAAEGVSRRRAAEPHLSRRLRRAPGSRYKDARTLAEDLVPIFNADLKDLVARGADYIQIEDLGAWRLDFEPGLGVGDRRPQRLDRRRRRQDRVALLPGAPATATRSVRVEDALPRVLERWLAVNVEQFALDFTLRDMKDVKALEVVPKDREVQVGVIDVRTLYIESDDEIVERIHKVLEHISPEQVYLSTDCGLKALPRFCAFEKLKALSRAAERVRAEIGSSSTGTLAQAA